MLLMVLVMLSPGRERSGYLAPSDGSYYSRMILERYLVVNGPVNNSSVLSAHFND